MHATARSHNRDICRTVRVCLALAALSAVCLTGCSTLGDSGAAAPSFASGGPNANAANLAQQDTASPWQRVKDFVTWDSQPELPENATFARQVSLNTPAEASPNLYTRLAQINEQSQNKGAAVENYRRALKLDPTHLDAVMGLARLYDRDGDFSTATTLYLQAAAIAPNNPSVQNDLGLCMARQSRFEEAAGALQKSVAASPDSQLYRNNLATVQVELRQYDAALENLRAVHAPEIAEYNLGYLMTQKKDFARARAHFENAVRLQPQFTEAKAALASLGGPSRPAYPQTNPPAGAPGNSTPKYSMPPGEQQQAPPTSGPRLGERYPQNPGGAPQ